MGAPVAQWIEHLTSDQAAERSNRSGGVCAAYCHSEYAYNCTMSLVLGIDGGNSKTHALILSDRGEVLGFGAGPGSNFQVVGLEATKRALNLAINHALSQSDLQLRDIQFGCFCLAGADLPEDYCLLQQTVEALVQPMKVKIKNDTIAALQAGLHLESFGVTVVVGAGFNAAGRGKDGREIVLPGLGYISGDYGGGQWMGQQIIQAIMRAWDERGTPTSMRQPVLEIMGAKDEMELIRTLRREKTPKRLQDLMPVLFEAAYEGDEVAQSLLTFLGQEVGLTAGVLIRRLGLEKEEVPVVLSTSVFRGKGPLLLDVITETVHRIAPKARIIIPVFAPVVGAAIEALNLAARPLYEALLNKLEQELRQKHPELIYTQTLRAQETLRGII